MDMMFSELAAQRRSVRKFTERAVEQELIDQMIAITQTAPSSKNTKSTRLAYTCDREVLEMLSRIRDYGSGFLKDAPMAFLVMGDDTQTDLWRDNCAISATMLQLAAQSLGLGSCWVHVNGRPCCQADPEGRTATEFIHENLPATQPYRILCVVAVGYAQMQHRCHSMEIDPEMVIPL